MEGWWHGLIQDRQVVRLGITALPKNGGIYCDEVHASTGLSCAPYRDYRA
jgi:hypothetical protein